MASHLISQHQQSSFATPVNGGDGDATVVLGNDNATVTSYNAHDADPTIHVQDSALADRSAAGTAGRKWMTVDSSVVRLFFDNGSSWLELNAMGVPVTITSTTSPQFTVAYDGSNHFQATVSSAGAVTFNATGASAGFTFSDTITLTTRMNSATSAAGSSFAATGGEWYAHVTNGASVGGFGTTYDAAILNRSGTVALGVTANSTSVVIVGGLTVGAVTSTGQLLVTLTTEQQRLRYDASNYLSITIAADGEAVYNAVGTDEAHTFRLDGTGKMLLTATTLTFDTSFKLATSASTATRAGFFMPSGTAPSVPVDGDFWYDGSTLCFRHAGATKTLDWT